MVFTKTYSGSPICLKEVLRYAGCKNENVYSADVLNECICAAERQLTYKVCYSIFDITVQDDKCDLGAFVVSSTGLGRNLEGCKRAVIFAATVGIGIDRLISKYSAVEPSRALLFQAIGAERIESLCDKFCEDIGSELKSALRPRFSPGYSDFDLSYQKDIFSILSCERHIGLTLNESMMMSPSKSVTAIMGMCEKAEKSVNKCSMCENKNCAYRGVL